MKKFLLLVFLLFGLNSFVLAGEKQDLFAISPADSFPEVTAAQVDQAFGNLAPHPRLLLTDKQINNTRKKIADDPVWAKYYEALQQRADDMMKRKPVEYKLTGIRLLHVSRDALSRLANWSFLYRMTKETKYASRAEEEMLAVAAFPDWHPQHYLDTAEMTLAVALGYDACYDALSPQSRQTIRQAILEKGIKTSTEKRGGWLGWMKNNANWNQVCHTGLLFGALAIAEDDPELARKIVRRSANGVTWSMQSYEPDGTYTEGPGYWSYGTSFNILLVAGLQSALGTDFGRGDSPGLLKTIQYYESTFGATGTVWNYPDSGGGRMFEPTAMWFTQKLNDPAVTYSENRQLLEQYQAAMKAAPKRLQAVYNHLVNERLAFCSFLWGPQLSTIQNGKTVLQELPAPKSLGYIGIGNGLCPVALFRTSWTDPNAAWLGIKAGTPRSPHGHADSGSFVYEKAGVRWAIDLGPESYHKIEQLGMTLWSSQQTSDRWKLFRYNNFSHNTLTVNGALQLVDGKGVFTQTHIGSAHEA
ncbi:MAG: heparinase II/III family protein, partial [Thermoguttaceae bacterium]|nr:heparinase II/III family protein [Thermoguttaceae bacterium]